MSSLGPAVAGTGATWIAAAITAADRDAAAAGIIEAEGFRLRSLVIDEESHRQFYDTIANSTLWFLHHNLWDLSRQPIFDRYWREAWETYRAVNLAFADAVAEEASAGATVLVQDYHLSLVGGALGKERPDLNTVHFHHTPFCEPTNLRVLPDDVGIELLAGMAGHRACGFHTARWAAGYSACTAAAGLEPARTFVAPAAPDLDDIQAVARTEACEVAYQEIDELVGDRALIVRVDRIELSKNIQRGFLAYDLLLRTHPELRERVVFLAHTYPSREGLPEYLTYGVEMRAAVERINDAWATPGWTPIVLETTDDFPRSIAALRRSDVLLVNPTRDGLNLVAKEGSIVNERDGVLVLSREAGVCDELGSASVQINPFDIAGTADALHEALGMDKGARAAMAAARRQLAHARTPVDWLDDQLRAART